VLGTEKHHEFNKNNIIQWIISIIFMFFCSSAWADETHQSVEATKTATVEIPDEDVATKAETPDKIKTINTKIIAEIDSTVIVKLDGETLESTEVHRSDDGNLYVNAMPIFQHLGNDVEYDDISKALIVRRSQDNVVMELYTDTGIVKADGRTLGKLEHFGEVEPDHFILTPNAIAVLAGTAGTFDADSNEFHFKLDPRLKVATGFDIFVDDIPLGAVNPEPKSVGPVLLLPLRPIAEALGNSVHLTENGSVVEIRRVQDSVTMRLNLSTGLVSANDKPVGLSKDISYIDQTNLLLPVSALEALTGTNVDVEAGSDRINVRLDGRLAGSIAPMSSVDEVTKNAPFTPESLRFQVSPDTGVGVQFDAHAGRVNGRLRYELQDLPSNANELRPNWLSVDFAHTSGVTGSIGDYSANLRELDPVNTRRIVGVAGRHVTKSGRWAFAGGAPLTGAKEISANQNRNEFGGLVAGVRYADADGWEAGLAAAHDNLSKDQRIVLEAISGRLGRKSDKKIQWNADAAIGAFNGPERESSVDLRIDGDFRYAVSKEVGFNLSADYTGAEFLRSNLAAEEQAEDIAQVVDPDVIFDDPDTPPDIRRKGSDEGAITATLGYSPHRDFGFIKSPTASVTGVYQKTGILKSGITQLEQTSLSAAVTATLGETGINVSGSTSVFDSTSQTSNQNTEKIDGSILNAQVFKQFKDYTVRAQYGRAIRSDAEKRESASVTVSRSGYGFNLPKGSSLTVGPSLSGVWDGENWRARGGVNAGFRSGELFGKKNVVTAHLGILQSISTRGDARSDKFLTLSAARKLKIGKNMSLGLAYRNDLRGNHRLGLQLDGYFNFNPRRAIKKTEDGRGILKGQVFLDRNRDGIRQPAEVGIPRVIVRVKGTSLALRSGADGFFTIQNVREGLYDVQIDARSLPIGYDLASDIQSRVTIAEGQITDIPLPIVQRGQIRGFAFEDNNGNGEYDRGETRVEGAKLQLTSEEGDLDTELLTTSFGQYAFDDLPQGKYKVQILPLEKAGILGGEHYTVELGPESDLMARQNLIVTRSNKPRFVSVELPEPNVNEEAPLKIRKGTIVIEDHETPSVEILSSEAPIGLPDDLPIPRLKPFTSVLPPDDLSGAAPP